jgi:hypothetical protein
VQVINNYHSAHQKNGIPLAGAARSEGRIIGPAAKPFARDNPMTDRRTFHRILGFVMSNPDHDTPSFRTTPCTLDPRPSDKLKSNKFFNIFRAQRTRRAG